METNPVQADSVDDYQPVDIPEDESTSLVAVANELQAKLNEPADKSEFYKYLGLSMDKYDVTMDEATATRYKRHIMSLKHGMHAGVPLTCYGGKKCPIGSRCPFTQYKADGKPDYNGSIYPLFKPCPIEADMAKIHMMNLVEEYSIRPDDYTDIAIVSKLATLDILEYRCNMSLATDPQGMVISEVSSVDYQSGKEFISRKINPAFDIIEKIHRMRQDLFRSMVGTRREKYKAAAAAGEKATATGLQQDLHALVEIIENKRAEEDILDAEFEDMKLQEEKNA
jgi:hypothetical protein